MQHSKATNEILRYPVAWILALTTRAYLWLVAVFGNSYVLMRLLTILLAVGSLGWVYDLVRRVSLTGVAGVMSMMTAGSYALVMESAHIGSDVPYMAVPAVPANSGVFDFIVMSTLESYGVERSLPLSAAIVVHAIFVVPIFLVGMPVLLRDRLVAARASS